MSKFSLDTQFLKRQYAQALPLYTSIHCSKFLESIFVYLCSVNSQIK